MGGLFETFDLQSVLFIASFLLFAFAFLLSHLFSHKARVANPLIVTLLLILSLLFGVVMLELNHPTSPTYVFAGFLELHLVYSTHRWLLFQLPVLLGLQSLVILLVYRNRLAGAHAKSYRMILMGSLALGVASMFLIALEGSV